MVSTVTNGSRAQGQVPNYKVGLSPGTCHLRRRLPPTLRVLQKITLTAHHHLQYRSKCPNVGGKRSAHLAPKAHCPLVPTVSPKTPEGSRGNEGCTRSWVPHLVRARHSALSVYPSPKQNSTKCLKGCGRKRPAKGQQLLESCCRVAVVESDSSTDAVRVSGPGVPPSKACETCGPAPQKKKRPNPGEVISDQHAGCYSRMETSLRG